MDKDPLRDVVRRMKDPKTGVKLKHVKAKVKITDTFTGRSVVNWIHAQKLTPDRRGAQEVGNLLLKFGFLTYLDPNISPTAPHTSTMGSSNNIYANLSTISITSSATLELKDSDSVFYRFGEEAKMREPERKVFSLFSYYNENKPLQLMIYFLPFRFLPSFSREIHPMIFITTSASHAVHLRSILELVNWALLRENSNSKLGNPASLSSLSSSPNSAISLAAFTSRISGGELPPIIEEIVNYRINNDLRRFGHALRFRIITGPGPQELGVSDNSRRACCRATSALPLRVASEGREGDPVTHRFCVQLHKDRICAVLTTGCTWGRMSHLASNVANNAFASYVSSKLYNINKIDELAAILIRGLEVAHQRIVKGKDNVWDAGTVFLIGGVLLPLDEDGTIKRTSEKYDDSDEELEGIKKKTKEKKAKEKSKDDQNGRKGTRPPKKFIFICVNLGDNKAFHYVSRLKRIRSINSDIMVRKDQNGRLGPAVGGGLPDTRNLAMYLTVCEEDDVIIMTSGSVFANLSPEAVGCVPSDFKSYLKEKKWGEIDKPLCDKIHHKFTHKLIQKIIHTHSSRISSSSVSPHSCTNSLVEWCLDVSSKARHVLQEDPKATIPADFTAYPGVLDHVSVLSFLVKCDDS